MAHLRDFGQCQYGGCQRPASTTLYSWRNEKHAEYCKTHGASELKKLQKMEDSSFA